MAVRFLPDPGERSAPAREERSNLAEVIELRTQLNRRVPENIDLEDDASPRPSGDDSEAEGLFHAPDEAELACREAGVKFLARRARSSGELRQELQRLEYSTALVEDVIAEFETSLYLDDTGLARTLTEKLRESKRASKGQIRVKLRERRLRDDVIEAVLGELDGDEEFDLLREAARERARKLGGLDRQTAERRLLAFLARRGWSGEPVMRAVRDALDSEDLGGGKSRGFSPGSSSVRFQ